MGNQPSGSQYATVDSNTKVKGKKSKRGQTTSPDILQPVNHPPPVNRNTQPPKSTGTQPVDLLSGSPSPSFGSSQPPLAPLSQSTFLSPITTAKPKEDYFAVTQAQKPNPSQTTLQPQSNFSQTQGLSNQPSLNPQLGAQNPLQKPGPVSSNPLNANNSSKTNIPQPTQQKTPQKEATANKPVTALKPGTLPQQAPQKPSTTQVPTKSVPTSAATVKPQTVNTPATNEPKVDLKSDIIESSLKPYSEMSTSACHLNITDMEIITIESKLEIRPPKLQAEFWLLYIPIPPLTSFQTDCKVWVELPYPSKVPPRIAKINDDLERELLQVIIPVAEHQHFQQILKISVFFQLASFARELFFDPTVQLPAQVATGNELDIYSSDKGKYTLTDKTLQQYFHANGNILYRNPEEIGDQTIIYAQRVFHYISENFSFYQSDSLDRSLVNIINAKKSDSLGLSLLFCSFLRLQEVPARVVIGRQLKTEMIPYAIAEFYVPQVGWIPADICSMVIYGKDKPKSNQGRLPHFGEQSINFIGFHYDMDFNLDTIKYGIKTLETLQNIPFWVSGKGPLDGIKAAAKWHVVKREKPN